MAETDVRELANLEANIARLAKGVDGGLFAPALEAACVLIVNESRRRDRPLAWNDVTTNLRASISYQVEGVVGPQPGTTTFGDSYNDIEYRSGEISGDHGVVFAPMEYAVHVEMKSTRSVLAEPIATVREQLLKAVATDAGKEWVKEVMAADVRAGA